MKIAVPSPLVSVIWLQEHLEADNVIVLNATIMKVVDKQDEIVSVQIPSARFFDIKRKFSDTSGEFPNTFPSETQFTKEAQALGINKDSCIIVYDEKGVYSSARVWWMFKAFGHNNVAVLDGGLPAWNYAGFELKPNANDSVAKGNFIANYQPDYMKFFSDVLKESKDSSHTIIDARSENRFKGLEPEPRKGLRNGAIPNSKNVPYTDLLDKGCLKTIPELKTIFENTVSQDDKITFSCGSGITACILALGAELAGYKNISVYDGSWTEWGSLTKE